MCELDYHVAKVTTDNTSCFKAIHYMLLMVFNFFQALKKSWRTPLGQKFNSRIKFQETLPPPWILKTHYGTFMEPLLA